MKKAELIKNNVIMLINKWKKFKLDYISMEELLDLAILYYKDMTYEEAYEKKLNEFFLNNL